MKNTLAWELKAPRQAIADNKLLTFWTLSSLITFYPITPKQPRQVENFLQALANKKPPKRANKGLRIADTFSPSTFGFKLLEISLKAN